MKSFYQIGAAAAFLSVITTIGIHSFITGPGTFEEALKVFDKLPYILSKWWVIVHCLLVMFSMYALSAFLEGKGKPLARLGLIFFAGFGLFEIARQFLVLTYLHGLRERYLLAETDELREIIRLGIDSFSGIGLGLFAAFAICFLFGNLLFGLSLVRLEDKLARTLGAVLLFWSLASAMGLVNLHLRLGAIDEFFQMFNISFQPIARLLAGVFLWRVSRAQNALSE